MLKFLFNLDFEENDCEGFKNVVDEKNGGLVLQDMLIVDSK